MDAKNTSEGEEEKPPQEDGPLLNVAPWCGALVAVMREPGVVNFTKFLQHNAPSSRWDVKMVFGTKGAPTTEVTP